MTAMDEGPVMSTHTIWDIPSSTLLLETRELDTVIEVTGTYVSENGREALSDIMLGIDPGDSASAHDHSGSQILEAIEREQGALRVR